MNKYYRVCKDYYGEEFNFVPNNYYECLEETLSGEVICKKDGDKINEVCFSKTIPNCFFAISMFLKENETYHIYETTQEPCISAYKCRTGDFEASQEVRYRVPVKARYIGKFNVHSYFLEGIESLYREFQYGDFFDSKSILNRLSNNYNTLYNEIKYANLDIEKEFESMKVSEEEFEDFLYWKEQCMAG
ncbi:MAG: hypothetical protein IJ086_15325 [Clostridium sp.]|nr:hypothetical protein [Clostridium sp.]MBQ9000047.1 hypothetical protein [Clostridium sp.]